MSTIFNKPINEIIQMRHSIRNYTDESLSIDLINKINEYIENVNNPFNKNIKIKLIEKDSFDNIKLGTYGVIKGAKYFLVSACDNEDKALTALGYTLEKVILYCTSLGLGTVWLGGTFNKSNFSKTINLSENEIVPIVSPVGYESNKKSIISYAFGKNSNRRKSFEAVFFNKDLDNALSHEEAGNYFEPLEMLRLAPSAVNMQPWRVIKDNEKYHFYVNNSRSSLKDYSKIDIGIALCHFHLSCIENNLDGDFNYIDSIKDKYHNLTYILSWTSK